MVAKLHATPLRTPAIIAPTTFLQISNVIAERFPPNRRTISPSHRHVFAKNRRISFLQITERSSPKSPNDFSKSPTHFHKKSPNKFSPNRRTCLLQIANVFCRSASNILSFLFSSEKTQSPISPYTCHGLRAPRYGWSVVVPWSGLLTPSFIKQN